MTNLTLGVMALNLALLHYSPYKEKQPVWAGMWLILGTLWMAKAVASFLN